MSYLEDYGLEGSDSAGVTNRKVTAIAKEGSRAGEEPTILHSRDRVLGRLCIFP